jgi:hypothetical protein
MTISERLEILSQVVNDERTARRISQVAAIQVIAEYKQRIFFLGLDSLGSQIGTYSVNPFYINPLSLTTVASSGIKPEGKNGNTVFKNGNPHKTKYLKQGYKELRELTDRQSGTVDLNFSGSLFQSIKVTESGLNSAITYTNDEMAAIMEFQESPERFAKDISTVSTAERELGETAARNELLAILEEIDLL